MTKTTSVWWLYITFMFPKRTGVSWHLQLSFTHAFNKTNTNPWCLSSIICIRWADGLSSFFHSCCGWRGKRTGAVWFYNQASRPIKVYEGEDDGWRESVKTFYSPTIWFYLSGLFCVVLIIRLRMDTSQIYRCVIIRAVWYKDTSGICILKDAIFSLITFHNLHTKRFIFPIREASVKKKKFISVLACLPPHAMAKPSWGAENRLYLMATLKGDRVTVPGNTDAKRGRG